ncbi:DUF6438 domain-containing protein [Sphingomonas corticis]|jgi:hypothetical protein|uniref:DUF6438 domain-containing protein n=1 Tax=Sphingomonas corticis TaxID=2722791 RepID=A0ABX1CKU5_9SPHN|nr:DUF6438 domain-containing protein [Sphingomonas corticis]NJR78614.1 hypothetical protein [Sphingomonas corticis]
MTGFMRGSVMGAALILAGCAATDAGTGRPRPIEGESITYETAPCFGTCPVYRVTVNADGSGTFEGRRFTAVTGERAFTASPDVYRRFAAALEPYRPKDGDLRYENGSSLCGPAMVSDMPGADVRWSEPSGASRSIHFYYGCDRGDDGKMRRAIADAPQLLPIAAFIGKR